MKAPLLSNLTNFFTQSIDGLQCTIDLPPSSGFVQPPNCVVSVASESLEEQACVFAPESYMKQVVNLLIKNCVSDIKYKQVSPAEFEGGVCLPNRYTLLRCANNVDISTDKDSMYDMCRRTFFEGIGPDCQDPSDQFNIIFMSSCASIALLMILCLLVRHRCKSRPEALASQDGRTSYNTLDSDENPNEGSPEDEDEDEDDEDRFNRLMNSDWPTLNKVSSEVEVEDDEDKFNRLMSGFS